jgi:hypothetical protein
VETKIEADADGMVTSVDTPIHVPIYTATWDVASSEYRLCKRNVEGVTETVLQRMHVKTNLKDSSREEEWVDVPTVEIG